MIGKSGYIVPFLAIGIILIAIFLLLVFFGPEFGNKLGFFSSRKAGQESKAAQVQKQSKKEQISPSAELPLSTPSLKPSPVLSPSATAVTGNAITYKQPQGKYTISLPSGWIVNNTTATEKYSTTKFTGPNGNVSITFGSGKDPAGGCSETTSIQLADRVISGCLLLQKDGSQILTRGYTKDSAGISFTIEAYFNPPASSTRPAILEIIRTIDIL